MSLIQVSNLTFGYDGSPENVFENVSFSLDTAWRTGLIGRNGRGKSTLLHLLAGEYAYTGQIRASERFEYYPYPIAEPQRTTAEVMRSVCNGEDWQFERELSLLGVREDVLARPFSTLSGGERVKAQIAALFLRENSFLLLDEPTNHLDSPSTELLARYLRSKTGFLLVSHDRYLLDACTDHILAINRTNIEVQSGNFSSWQENKQRTDAFEAAKNRKLIGEIRKLGEAAERASRWSENAEGAKYATRNSGLRPDRGYIGHKAAKLMKRAGNIEQRRDAAVEEKSKLLKNVETAEKLKLIPLSYHAPVVVRGKDFSVCYDGKAIFRPLTFEICRGERVALCGANGCGKSSVLKAIAGDKKVPFSGDLNVGSGVKISYVSQEHTALRGSLDAYAAGYGIDKSLFFAILRKMDFERTQFEKDIASFSDGQKKKTELARSLCESAHLYIWDEPLNFVDVFSRMQLEELICEFHPTLLFVEHDRRFVENIGARRIAIEG